MSPEEVCTALREAGLNLRPDEIALEAREDRWLARLPGDRMAWFAANERGARRLVADRRLLRLLAERCRFSAPRVLYESGAGFDLRAAVPGSCDPAALYARIATDQALARRLGHALGLVLAEQHGRIARPDVAGWLPEHVPWPEPAGWIRERLPEVTDDAALLARIDRVLDARETLDVPENDRALVHGDLGVHNIAVDPVTGDLRGVFDYDGAAWDDRHQDFRYLVFDHADEGLLEAAIAAYEPAAGHEIDRERVRLYNAASAICYLAYRRGVAADVRHCGRTLAEDLAWVRKAVDAVP
ncbi:hypothetical protein P409_30140 [Inquilinus limosus MP06]|uniref:Aminoglycoside phosphotransferase domain-containing protein n=2 Tax=Inquilinus limosus TaxID=171674 RepID=A0A0A0D1L6_9PROT|nr:hypothetical protein P409_30140 [Inquilinus limosus MP06]